MTADNRPYFYRLRGRTMGPVSLRQIRQLVQRAQVNQGSDISRDGVSWSKAAEFSELFQAGGAGEPAGPGDGDDQGKATDGGQWYYVQGGARQGPVDLGTIQGLVSTGRLAAGDQVFKAKAMDSWTPVAQVAELAGLIPTMLPKTGSTSSAETVATDSTATKIRTVEQGDDGPTQVVIVGSQTNGMAICGFILSLPVFCPPIGLLLCILALNSPNRANRGLAIAGTLLGSIYVTILVIYLIAALVVGVTLNLPR